MSHDSQLPHPLTLPAFENMYYSIFQMIMLLTFDIIVYKHHCNHNNNIINYYCTA